MTRGENRFGARYRLTTGHLLILGAAIMWSTSGLFAKSPVFSDWPIMGPQLAIRGPLLAFWRALFACVILIPLVRRPRWTVKLIPAVLVFALMNFTFLTALTTTTAANAIWLQYTAPVWVFLFGAFFLREPIQHRDWLMLGFALAGIGLILAFEGRDQTWVGVVYGLSAGLCYAGVVLTLRWLRDEDAAWLVALNHFVTAALFFPFVVITEIWPSYHQWSYLVGFGVLQMGIPYLLFARGLRTVAGHEASLVVLLEPVLVPLWVFLAWRSEADYQPPAIWTLGGGLLILCGLLARYVPWKR
jgi:DME family drug/metabolite transporter